MATVLTLRRTHFVPWDSPGYRKRQALCGAFIDYRDHSNDPTCDECKRLLDERENAIGPQ
jgi:hypothetical protein